MTEYISAAMRYAVYESDTDGSTYGTLAASAGLHAVAQGRTYADCVAALRRTIARTVMQALHAQQPLPEIDGVQPPAN
jgi:predicted RNase H-like HicB family nuclease